MTFVSLFTAIGGFDVGFEQVAISGGAPCKFG